MKIAILLFKNLRNSLNSDTVKLFVVTPKLEQDIEAFIHVLYHIKKLGVLWLFLKSKYRLIIAYLLRNAVVAIYVEEDSVLCGGFVSADRCLFRVFGCLSVTGTTLPCCHT